MDEQMFPQTISSSEFLLTRPTLVWLYPDVDEQMLLQTYSSSEFLFTILTEKFSTIVTSTFQLKNPHHPSQQSGTN